VRSAVPDERISRVNRAPVREERAHVLYWMVAARRTRHSFALARAVDWACALNKPLVVLEALRCDYPWASDRLHGFLLDGMSDQAAELSRTPALYHAYVEPQPGAGKGLLEALAGHACVVVTDCFPAFFLPRMVAAAGRRLDVALEQVDGNGLYPLAATDRVFTTAASFRRHLQKELPGRLAIRPEAEPLARLPRRTASLPAAIRRRWPAVPASILAADRKAGAGSRARRAAFLANVPVDHHVAPAPAPGGARAAAAALDRFLEHGLPRYLEARNHPGQEVTSQLSPYLHFGHISAHEVFERVMASEDWSPARLADRATGSREGWWGAGPGVEAFLDQLVTWRELGYHEAARRPDHDRYESLPPWARATLEAHARDVREHVYDLAAFEDARTHDALWNAAQRQLVREGRIHNYMRMLWGKKILEWTTTPREALQVMVALNDKYALDGRDPNSYSGIFWCLGRYDRPWGPERPIFGKVRYMSSENTARKYRVTDYLAVYGP
jgi:deoxyribodipyrimidine photo-lyase